MKPQHKLATFMCFGTSPFCALLSSALFAFTGNSRKHQPNPRTDPNRTSANITVDRSPDTALAMSSRPTPFKTHSSR